MTEKYLWISSEKTRLILISRCFLLFFFLPSQEGREAKGTWGLRVDSDESEGGQRKRSCSRFFNWELRIENSEYCLECFLFYFYLFSHRLRKIVTVFNWNSYKLLLFALFIVVVIVRVKRGISCAQVLVHQSNCCCQLYKIARLTSHSIYYCLRSLMDL